MSSRNEGDLGSNDREATCARLEAALREHKEAERRYNIAVANDICVLLGELKEIAENAAAAPGSRARKDAIHAVLQRHPKSIGLHSVGFIIRSFQAS